MKTQLLEQCMVPRALFGSVENISKSVDSVDSQLLLSRPSVTGAYFRNTQEKQLLGYQLYCFQYVATAVFFMGNGQKRELPVLFWPKTDVPEKIAAESVVGRI